MGKIVEAIISDGEVIPLSDFNSEQEFEYKLLNSLDFETVKSFFIKKIILDTVKERDFISNGSNGVSEVEMMNLLKREDVEVLIKELEEKRLIRLRKGINHKMYFVYKRRV